MDERDINYISIPRSEWTDETAWIAIKIIEMKTEKNPGKKIRENAVKKRNKNTFYNRNL